MITDEEIQQRLDRQATLIEQAAREKWFLPPLPIAELATALRAQQAREASEERWDRFLQEQRRTSKALLDQLAHAYGLAPIDELATEHIR